MSINAVRLLEEVNPVPFLNVGTKLDDVVEAGTQAGVLATKGKGYNQHQVFDNIFKMHRSN